jgi:hypothetical protein
MKKTWAVWAIICVFALSVLLELTADYGVLIAGHAYYSNAALSLIAVLSLNLDIIVSAVLVYKLFNLNWDALVWTNIEFGYSVVRLMFQMTADAVLNTGTLIPNGVEMLIVILIWWAFYRHLQEILAQRWFES